MTTGTPTFSISSLLAATLVLGFTIEWLADSPTAHDLDVRGHVWVVGHRSNWPAVSAFYRVVTQFGNPGVAVPVTVLVTIGLFVLARRGVGGLKTSESLVWLGTILGGRYLGLWLKHLFRRPRPPTADWLVTETAFSYPSAHSVFSAVFFSMLALVIVRALPDGRTRMKAFAVGACTIMAVLVASSRVWLGVHYPADVLGGLVLGSGWVFVVDALRRFCSGLRGSSGVNK